MKYHLMVLLQLDKKNIINIVIDIVCLSLGLLVGLIFLSQANAARTDYELNEKYISLTGYTIYKPEEATVRLQREDIESLLTQVNGVENIKVFNRLSGGMVWYKDSFCPDMKIISVMGDYMGLFRGGYLTGEKMSDLQDAIIGQLVAQEYGMEIGDVFEIADHQFTIRGILSIPQYEDAVLTWHEALEDVDLFDCEYFIKVQPKQRETFKQFLEKNYGLFQIYTAQEYNEKQRGRLSSGWGASVVIAFITFCYGLVNIMNIETFFILKQKKAIAVMRALGASRRKIVISKLFRASFIAFLSATLTALMVCRLEKTEFGSLLKIHVSVYVYILSVLLIEVIYIAFSLILYYLHYRKNVMEIISEAES